jgi:hypothetical protein
MANEQNLKPLTTEKAREIGRKGGIASGKAKKEKKFMSQIYAEFLMKEHDIIGKDGLKKKLSGDQLLSSVMSKILARGDSASVSMLKEIRESLEGNKIKLASDDAAPLNITITPVKVKE